MELRIENSFEALTPNEWDKYLSTDIFNSMIINEGALGETEDVFPDINNPKLHELIFEYNNKVGALKVTYSLCKHYYDKGIPDDPWYISPGKDGSSIQYFPNFSEEH